MIKKTRMTGRKAGRSGTIVPNNVPTTPEDEASVVAVVASLFEMSNRRTAEANKTTTGDNSKAFIRLAVSCVRSFDTTGYLQARLNNRRRRPVPSAAEIRECHTLSWPSTATVAQGRPERRRGPRPATAPSTNKPPLGWGEATVRWTTSSAVPGNTFGLPRRAPPVAAPGLPRCD